MTDAERKLAKLEAQMRDAMRGMINGHDPRDVLGMHIAVEALSCAVMAAHRARVARLPKHLKKRVEKAHAMLVKTVLVLGGELSDAITEKSR